MKPYKPKIRIDTSGASCWECFANGGIWSERMSSGDDGFSWKCTYNPHTEVTIK